MHTKSDNKRKKFVCLPGFCCVDDLTHFFVGGEAAVAAAAAAFKQVGRAREEVMQVFWF